MAMGREKATISRQIQRLEKELGVTLFDRSSGKLVITHDGRVLLGKANELFDYLKRIRDDFKDEEIIHQGMINISATHGAIDNFLLPYVDHFRRLHPKVAFEIDGDNREVVYSKVESTDVDFGIAGFETGHKALVFHDLYEASRMIIAPKDNPFFPGKAVPTLRQIATSPLIITVYSGLHEISIDKLFAKAKLKYNVAMRCNNYFTTKKAVAQGMGIAILGEVCISQGDRQIYDIYNLDRYFQRRKYGILLKKNKTIPAVIKALLRTIKPDIDFVSNP